MDYRKRTDARRALLTPGTPQAIPNTAGGQAEIALYQGNP